MACGRPHLAAQENNWKAPAARNQAITKKERRGPLRQSARTKNSHPRPTQSDTDVADQYLFPSPVSHKPDSQKVTQARIKKRKREAEDYCIRDATEPSLERARRADSEEDTFTKASLGLGPHVVDPIDFWRREKRWPREYFEPDNNMSHLLAQMKSSSLRRKRSEGGSVTPSSMTPSDQRPREQKSAPYQDAHYEILLELKGSYMGQSELDLTDASKTINRTLLEEEQTFPNDTIFRDDLFRAACMKSQGKNEARVIQDIARLISPSAEALAIFGAKHLRTLVESVNEGWNNSIPVTETRPQPDYAVGFKRSAFSDDQLSKLQPFVGDVYDTSYFMATYYMYFPFFTCEVKCGAGALDIADRQNAHSMTLAVRGIVELFRLVKRENELNREILAFSISHDHHTVRIFGHYPVIEGKKTTFYRHPIHEFCFTALDGKEKWTAYRFTKNMYDIWVPSHFQRISSVIDQLPTDLDFELSGQSECRFPEHSGLSQELESRHLSQSDADSASLAVQGDNQSGLQNITPSTSVSQSTDPTRFKKPKKSHGALHHASQGSFSILSGGSGYGPWNE